MMKKWAFVLCFLPFVLFGEIFSEFYLGELKSQSPESEKSEHYGFLFLRRTLFPEENRFTDAYMIIARDGEVIKSEQNSELTGDLHEIDFRSTEGLVTGHGELVGTPWQWTSLKEKMMINTDGPVEIDVSNKKEGNTIVSIAMVYMVGDDGSKDLFGMFTARLHRLEEANVRGFFAQ